MLSMRLFIALILGTFLVIIGWQSNLFATNTQLPPQDNYADYMWQVHQNERPIPTNILTQAPTEKCELNWSSEPRLKTSLGFLP